ncbi:MAG TPA: ABC transporter permease [Limnochordales bacterium]
MDPRPVEQRELDAALRRERRRQLREALGSLAEIVVALIIGLGVGAVVMRAAGYNWLLAYEGLFIGSFGDPWAVADTLASATPLILTGLVFGLSARAGYFNIGAQGQMVIGALAAVAVGAHISAPPVVAVTVTFLAAGLAGAVWALPPAVLKATRGVHEVISTIMFNWIAHYTALYLVFNILNDPRSAERSVRVVPEARLGALIPGADMTAAIFVAVAVALGIYWLLWHSPWGYEMRIAGLNPSALRYAGANPLWSVNLTFILAGLAAGIAGATQIIGRPPTYALYGDLSNLGDLGFDGIAVALIGRNHPLGIILAAVFIGAMGAGARMMQIMAGVPLDMVRIVHGTVIIALAAPEAWSLLGKFLGAHRRRGQAAASAPAKALQR